uniref:Peptidase S1 domain-containing protein n=2 Tax=Ciona intestinalis TaxID=7719 RepID=H2XNM8_CIOIN
MFWVFVFSSFLVIANVNGVYGRDSRIVGGVDATLGRWPWQGSIRFISTGTNFCGCSVISNRWLISAAHCTEGIRSASSIEVRLGVTNLLAGEATDVTYRLTSFHDHPDYVSSTFLNDITLLQTSLPITFNANVRAVALPSPGMIAIVGSPCWITGWGTTADSSSVSPNILQQAVVPIVNDSQCVAWYRQEGIMVFTNEQFCAGYEAGNIDSCQGDSGGPLTCNDTGIFVLQGITSYGVGCALSRRPGVYTRVSNYLTWINETIVLYSNSVGQKCTSSLRAILFSSFFFLILHKLTTF